jgi:hypothetical protein
MDIVCTAYNRRLTKVSDLFDERRITFRSTEHSIQNDALTQGFRRCVSAYLHGCGHPIGWMEMGMISEAEHQSVENDLLFRSNLFLKACTDSVLLPMSKFWSISVSPFIR